MDSQPDYASEDEIGAQVIAAQNRAVDPDGDETAEDIGNAEAAGTFASHEPPEDANDDFSDILADASEYLATPDVRHESDTEDLDDDQA